MNQGKGLSFLFVMVHVLPGGKAKDDKGSHCNGDLTVSPGYEEAVPGKIHHGHAPHHAPQQCPQSNLSQEDMPLPPENYFLRKMEEAEALNPEVKHIQGQQHGRKLNNWVNLKHGRPHRSQGFGKQPVNS